jgi:hypothetical protein
MNLEDFQIKMSNSSPDEMGDIIEQMLDSKEIDFENEEVRESIREYRAQLEDYRNDIKAEQDKTCNEWIESGKCELYLCKKDVDNLWVSSSRYYVRVDDTKSQYIHNLSEVMDKLKPEVIEKINSMKPLIWVIRDNGIGTLKEKNVFVFDNFDDYFEKI